MKRLYKKMHSQEGASILLALLLFLLCAMVAASILAAAVSNAGKNKSNQIEQQKYLTLTSALQLVCDELEQIEYTGKYTVTEWDVITEVTDNNDPSNPVTTTTTKQFFSCRQTEGAYEGSDLYQLVPLENALDEIFAKHFTGAGYQERSGIENSTNTFDLTVELPSDLKGYPYSGPKVYEVDSKVTVKVELSPSTHHITLTAWLGTDDPTNGKATVVAELVAKNNTAPTLTDYSPGGRIGKSDDIPVPDGSMPYPGTELENDTTLPSGKKLPAGAVIPAGTKFSAGITIGSLIISADTALTDPITLSETITLTAGMTLPAGSIMPAYIYKEKTDDTTLTKTTTTVIIRKYEEAVHYNSPMSWELFSIKKGG